jgi:hypothetical protein
MTDEGSAGPQRRGRSVLHGGTPYARSRRNISEIQPAEDEAPEPRSEASPRPAGWGWRTLAATPFKVAGMLSNRVCSSHRRFDCAATPMLHIGPPPLGLTSHERQVGLTRPVSGGEKPAEKRTTADAGAIPFQRPDAITAEEQLSAA